MIRKNSDNSDDEGLSVATKWWLISTTKSNRRFSSHPVNEQRQTLGEYHHLYQELKEHPDRFHAYLRMTPETFQCIYKKIVNKLESSNNYNNYHINPIHAEEKLVLTIR